MRREEVLARMGMRLPMHKQMRVIISSDVGNEADDQFAIVHQLLTPMFDVRGVAAAHFESKAPGSRTTMERSFAELCRLMAASGMDDVPMLRGCDAPLANETGAPENEGVDFIIQEALREDDRPLYITAQGALTDVAAALNRRPEIAERLTVVWIGGGPYPQGGREFNLMQDVAAARAVLASKAEVWQLPVNVYGTVEVTMAEQKNDLYRELLMQMSPADLSDEVKSTLDALRAGGLKLAIGSSSKNAKLILGRIGLDEYFDAISDGTSITRSKPHPEVFLKAAEMLGLEPGRCLVVEDARAGVEAAVAGGFDSAGIGEAAEHEQVTYGLSAFSGLLNVTGSAV